MTFCVCGLVTITAATNMQQQHINLQNDNCHLKISNLLPHRHVSSKLIYKYTGDHTVHNSTSPLRVTIAEVKPAVLVIVH